MESFSDWKKTVLEHTADDPDHAQAVDALALLLKGEADADDTAKSVTMIYEVGLKRNNGSTYADCHNKVYEFWMSHICQAILKFESTVVYQRLIDLLKEISKQPDVKTPDGSVKMHRGCEAYWRDVPGWEFGFAEELLYYSRPGQYPLSQKDYFFTQASRLLKGTKFSAMLLEQGEFMGGLPRYAFDFLKMGVEQDYDEKAGLSAKVYEWQVLLPVTAIWLIVAGRAIYSHCLNDEVEDLRADIETQARWGGGSWTMQRWTLWKTQLEKFAKRQDFNDECRAVAMQTVQKMVEVEAGYKG